MKEYEQWLMLVNMRLGVYGKSVDDFDTNLLVLFHQGKNVGEVAERLLNENLQ